MTTTQTIICDSGLTGWRCPLRENYGSLADFEGYSDTFGVADRLGFNSYQEAWDVNPVVQGSTVGEDFRIHSVQIEGKIYQVVPVFDDEDENLLEYFDVFGPDGTCVNLGQLFYEAPGYNEILELTRG